MKTVFIVNPSQSYMSMMKLAGWTLVDNVEDADLVMFTGGSDVSPDMYGEGEHPRTYSDSNRDAYDFSVYIEAKEASTPMVGICRGGQFLNVMNGGKLYQHVVGHAVGDTHELLDVRSGRTLPVSSTHHQMMRAGPLGDVVGVSLFNLTNGKEYMSDGGGVVEDAFDSEPDTEVVLYTLARCLCFQPHPEFFYPDHECVKYFHELLEEIL